MKLGEAIQQLTELEKVHGSDIELRIISCEEAKETGCVQEVKEIEANTLYLVDDEYYDSENVNDAVSFMLYGAYYSNLMEPGKDLVSKEIQNSEQLKAIFIKGDI